MDFTECFQRALKTLSESYYTREITAEEYEALLLRADPKRRPIIKQRWILPYRDQRFEIDLFPFWEHQAYLELELNDESQEIVFPPEIEVIREVTDDKRYTNASLAREIPAEEAEGVSL